MKTIPFKSGKWKKKEIVLFLEKLELYISSGLSLDKCLAVIAENSSKGQCGSIMKVKESVESGNSLSKSLLYMPGFPQLVLNLIYFGELSGNLKKSIIAAKIMIEKEEQLKRKVVSAMIYPFVIAFFTGALTVGLVKGIMPQIIPMLKNLGADLPLLTRIVIFLSENLMRYGWIIAIIVLVSFFIFFISIKKFASFQRIVHSFVLQMPLAGRLVSNYHLISFFTSCGALIESGQSIYDSFSKPAQSVKLIPLRDSFTKNFNELNRGVSLGAIISTVNSIPPFVSFLIKAGEASGSLAFSINRVSDILSSDLDSELKKITLLIEPFMMASMGIVVGSVALSIMIPIYDISKVLQH